MFICLMRVQLVSQMSFVESIGYVGCVGNSAFWSHVGHQSAPSGTSGAICMHGTCSIISTSEIKKYSSDLSSHLTYLHQTVGSEIFKLKL